MKKTFCVILSAAALLSVASPSMYGRRKTTRKNLQVKAEYLNEPTDCWLVPDSTFQPMSFCGYEKKQSADKETLFIRNLTDSAFSLIRFTIRYFDSSEREIHTRQVEQRIDLLPKETRRIDIRSWDTQKSYYYKGGPAPRRVSATPYDVTVTLDSLLLSE